ncbi:MAG: hypothetical protein E7J38_11505, partial [Streptococcus salivarius]|nr:hypothetical protein [Streptococcus salivarius]
MDERRITDMVKESYIEIKFKESCELFSQLFLYKFGVDYFIKKFNKTTGNNNIIFLKLIKNDYFEKNRINGELLHKVKVVANIVNDELEVLNAEMLTIYFK